ncbi:MAG: hypothetical protein SVR94_01690 [Pseudomonadota bacterium]|nr:hypothetical protein [Pseudomonadota bacterium]
MSNQEMKMKYLLAINVKRPNTHNIECQIFEFKNKEERDSVIEEISERPDVTWATTEIVLH